MALTFTSDLMFRIILSGPYLLYYLRWESQIWCVWVHLGMVEFRVPFMGHCDLKPDLVFRIIVSGAYLILFEVGIPNLVCECILEWRIVPFHFPVTMTLTFDLVSRIGIESGV